VQHHVTRQFERDFFFQAEDGIRDGHVTGVQTCALPISEAIIATCSRFCSSTLSLGSGNKEGSGTSVEDRASAVLRYPSARNSSVVLGATAAAEGFPAAFALTFASSLRSFCTVLSQGT